MDRIIFSRREGKRMLRTGQALQDALDRRWGMEKEPGELGEQSDKHWHAVFVSFLGSLEGIMLKRSILALGRES
jgi:hypothetical protein